MPDDAWIKQFDARMSGFRNTGSEGDAVSIKLRVASGCFHREHSPAAYSLIDTQLPALTSDGWTLEEHESGPEILVWVAAGVALSKSVIDLVVTILKARQDGIKNGDRPNDPLEIIVRKMDDGDFKEKP